MICEKCQQEVEAFIPQSQTCHACGQAKRRETLLQRSAEMTEKECIACHRTKPIDDFFRDKRNTGQGGRSSSCKACSTKRRKQWRKKNGERERAYHKDYHQEHAREHTVAKFARKAGVAFTVEEYAAMLTAQNGVCKVCQKPSSDGKSLAIDHCHATGKVRGLLCNNCNNGLGRFKDDPVLLRSAIQYLEETTS